MGLVVTSIVRVWCIVIVRSLSSQDRMCSSSWGGQFDRFRAAAGEIIRFDTLSALNIVSWENEKSFMENLCPLMISVIWLRHIQCFEHVEKLKFLLQVFSNTIDVLCRPQCSQCNAVPPQDWQWQLWHPSAEETGTRPEGSPVKLSRHFHQKNSASF